MQKKIKHIFFDLDNTLWDTDRNSKITLQQMYKDVDVEEKYQLSFLDFFTSYYKRNENLWALYRQEKVTKQNILDQRFKKTFQELGVEDEEIWGYFDDNFLDKVVQNNHLIDNAEETLDYLKTKGYELHVVSNGFIQQTNRKVNDTSIKNYVTTITSGEEINKRKPAREVFELGMKKAQALPEESSFIGDDWEADVLGSKKTGMFPVFFNYKKDEKYKQNGFPIIRDLLELKNIF
ncbi:MAG: HAD hydrolase-like protein [Flavobacteriaceae bacterium]|jgi:putative hydrolase of the HAD superfamily|nr:HAD hydrolase-like protein [Flavobacteriaceae bacterium]